MTIMMAHQLKAFEEAKDRAYYALFMDQGTGKTLTAIRLVESHFNQGRISAVVVITTKGLLGNWSKVELPKHSGVPYTTHVWSLDKKKNVVTLPDRYALFYFLINVDGVLTQNFPDYFKKFLKLHPNFALVVDESTFCKSRTAARTKRVIKMATYANYRYLMSGTPVTNSPLDIYSQSEILKPGLLGYSNFYAFRARYAKIVNVTFGPRTFQKITGFRNIPELKEIIKSFASIVKKEECLDLPPKVYRTLPVELTKEQRRYYDDLKAQALTYIQGNQVSVINTISLINKLLQIVAGQIKLPDGTYVSIPNNRLEVLGELIDECPGKTLIWTSFVGTARDIHEYLGSDKCLTLPSGLTLEERHEVLEKFKSSSTHKALVANPASAGHGLTILEATNHIYYSLSYNYEHYSQSQDRSHRIGQTESVLYTHLISPLTIEGQILKALASKEAMANSLISNSAIKELFSDDQ